MKPMKMPEHLAEEHDEIHHHNLEIKEDLPSAEDKEIHVQKTKLICAWILVIPIMVLMFWERVFGTQLIAENFMQIIILFLALPVIFIIGFQTIKGGLRGLIHFLF